MALPTTIVSHVGIKGYHPPFKSTGGDFYAVVYELVATKGTIDVYKATDPTDSWTVQDAANNPVTGLGGSYDGLSVVQKGDILYMAADFRGQRYEYHEFDMSADTWSVTEETIDDLTNDPTEAWISIAVRSTGVPVVVYAGDTDQNMGGKKERVDVNVRTGGTWDGPIALDAAGDIHYGNPNVIIGPLTDDMHILWQRNDNTTDPPITWADTHARTLDPSDNLSTLDTDTAAAQNNLLGLQNGVSYDDAGTQRMFWIAANVFGAKSKVFIPCTEDGSDDIVIGTVNLSTVDPDIYNNGDVGITTIAELNGDIHQLFASATDQDLYYSKSTDDGATFTSPTEEIDAITVNFISANIYVRGADTVMAYVYDDGGVQKYNEKVLIAGAAPFLPLLEQKQNTLLRM